MTTNLSDLQTKLIIERYKFLNTEIHILNENAEKNLRFFQVIVTAIFGGGISLLISWENINISPVITFFVVRGLEGLIILLSLFIAFSMIASIASWFDYRKEETELLNRYVESRFREKPTILNAFRWYESYVIIFIVIIVIVSILYTEKNIIPLIASQTTKFQFECVSLIESLFTIEISYIK